MVIKLVNALVMLRMLQQMREPLLSQRKVLCSFTHWVSHQAATQHLCMEIYSNSYDSQSDFIICTVLVLHLVGVLNRSGLFCAFSNRCFTYEAWKFLSTAENFFLSFGRSCARFQFGLTFCCLPLDGSSSLSIIPHYFYFDLLSNNFRYSFIWQTSYEKEVTTTSAFMIDCTTNTECQVVIT